MISLKILNFMFEQRQDIFVVIFCRFCSLSHLELISPVIYTSNCLEVVNQTDQSVIMSFFVEFVLLQKSVDFSCHTQDQRSGVNLDFLVDESGHSVKIEVELIVGGKHLLIKEFFNVCSFFMTSLDDCLQLVVKRSIKFVFLHCFCDIALDELDEEDFLRIFEIFRIFLY